MKKIFLTLLLALPLAVQAQNWETFDPAKDKQPVESPQTVKAEKPVKKSVDPKYLAGAVPVVDGRVQWTLNLDVPGKSAQEIYDTMLDYWMHFVEQDNQLEGSHIALVNKAEHSIAVMVKEWLVFRQTLIGIDRAKTTYHTLVKCTDGHLEMSLSRVIFDYTENVPGKDGIMRGEDWITDAEALNKKQTKILPGCVKFRTKMIDRKDEIFAQIEKLFNQ